MLREYEFAVITNPQLSEQDTEKLLDKYVKLVTGDGGEVVRKDDWGVRKMAHVMKSHYRGHYTFYDYVGTPDNLAEAERLMRIDDNILRYLAIRIGENVDVEARKVEIAKAEAKRAAEKKENANR